MKMAKNGKKYKQYRRVKTWKNVFITISFVSLGKGMNPAYPPSYGLNSITTVLLETWLWDEITYKGWYAIKTKQLNQERICW